MTARIRTRGRRGRDADTTADTPAGAGLPTRGLRFLLARRRVLLRLTAWSVLETGQTFLVGYGPARALDEGFLRGRADVGLVWLAVTGLGVLLGAYGTARVYAAVAALVEPLRDRLVERVVTRGVRTGGAGSLSGLTQQVEIARDTFAGLVMVSRSFVFTAAGALAGLFTLAPPLLLIVGPPLVVGMALFAATLRPLARRQETFLVADEALAGDLGTVCPGLRDITATGAEAQIAAGTGERVEAELRAARALAHWGVLRVASLTIGGQLPIGLLLTAGPWLLSQGVTAGALGGALQGSLGLPASANLDPEKRFPSMFEPVHGSAPDIMGRGIANPMGTVWAGVMMLEHMGWNEAADLVVKGLTGAIARKTVTYDLERQMQGATLVSTSRFGEEIARDM